MFVILIGLQIVTLAVALYAARKAWHLSRMVGWGNKLTQDVSWRTTQQIEALDGLYHRLDLPRGSLPPTRGWAASPDFLTNLCDYIEEHRPAVIVECGSGVSTIVAARFLQRQGIAGHILSLDHDAVFAGKTAENLRRLGLGDYATVCTAPLTALDLNGVTYQWYDLSGVNLPAAIDLIVVDGPPMPIAGEEGRYPAGPMLARRLAGSGAIMLDDANRPGERRIVSRLLAEFPNLARQELYAEKGCVLLVNSGGAEGKVEARAETCSCCLGFRLSASIVRRGCFVHARAVPVIARIWRSRGGFRAFGE